MENLESGLLMPVEVCPDIHILESWTVDCLHDGGQHDGHGAGAHLGHLANAGEEDVVALAENVLSETCWNVLQPLSQPSLHRFWNVDALEPELTPPQHLGHHLPHHSAPDISENIC